jgi:hypothetical protein
MKRSLMTTLLLAAGVAAVPGLGNAATQSTAMNSCVNAFMESLARHNSPLKLRESRLLNSPMTSGMTPVASELVLTATDAHDYHTIGRAVCRLGAHGQMLGLEEVPAHSLLPPE